MQSDRPVTKRLFAMRRDLLRGDSLFALMIFIVVNITTKMLDSVSLSG